MPKVAVLQIKNGQTTQHGGQVGQRQHRHEFMELQAGCGAGEGASSRTAMGGGNCKLEAERQSYACLTAGLEMLMPNEYDCWKQAEKLQTEKQQLREEVEAYELQRQVQLYCRSGSWLLSSSMQIYAMSEHGMYHAAHGSVLCM